MRFWDEMFPFDFKVPPNLVGPDSSGGFYGAALDVPAEDWTVQTEAGTGNWMPPDEVLDPKSWVRAKPIPPAPFAVGDKVVWVSGGETYTVIGVDGWWYWISAPERRRMTVQHKELLPPKPAPEDSP